MKAACSCGLYESDSRKILDGSSRFKHHFPSRLIFSACAGELIS
jgi:hypothetical protein